MEIKREPLDGVGAPSDFRSRQLLAKQMLNNELEGEALERYIEQGVLTTTLDKAVSWARGNSFFPLTFGLAYILEDGTRYIWGAQSLPFPIPSWLTTPLSTEFFFLTGYRLFMVALVAIAVGGLFFILNRTRLGIRIRAGTLDLETVSVLGVNVGLLRNLNFGLGIYLAGLAGVLAAGMLGLQPTIGTSLIMPSFVAIIIGGLGSLPGTLLGGLLIGVASGLTTVFFPSATEAVIYIMMALVLLVRPRGLLGEEGRTQ